MSAKTQAHGALQSGCGLGLIFVTGRAVKAFAVFF
jgi:hypothetical protein